MVLKTGKRIDKQTATKEVAVVVNCLYMYYNNAIGLHFSGFELLKIVYEGQNF